MANFHSINGNEIEAHYAGGELLQTVELAMQGITGDEPTDSAAWLQRVSTSDGPTTAKGIHGRTLRWNQLADNGNFANGSYHWAARESTLTVADGVATVTPNSDGTARGLQASPSMGTAVIGHKYLISTEFNTNEATNLQFSFSGASPVTVVVPSTGAWHKCRAIWTNGNETRVLPYILAVASVTTSAQLKYRNVQIFDLTAMFGAGSEPSTIEEFTALYPLPYYEYDAGSLLPVRMLGIETVGFNQWDEVWTNGYYAASGTLVPNPNGIASSHKVPCMPSTTYYLNSPSDTTISRMCFYDASGTHIDADISVQAAHTFTTPTGAYFYAFSVGVNYGTTYNHDICINLSDPTRNGTYEPYWSQTRSIDVASFFPDGMRGVGDNCDELTETAAITRVGEAVIDGNTAIWVSSSDGAYMRFATSSIPNAGGEVKADRATCTPTLETLDAIPNGISSGGASNRIYFTLTASETTAELARQYLAAHPITINYPLDTPTTTPIDPPLNMTYRTEQGGTERVMVPTGELSAPPTIVTAQGYTAESLRDAALSTIAPVENGLASTNYAVGSYLVHGGQLCKVTTAIATGESITIGTNVTATTVMAEILSLVQ